MVPPNSTAQWFPVDFPRKPIHWIQMRPLESLEVSLGAKRFPDDVLDPGPFQQPAVTCLPSPPILVYLPYELQESSSWPFGYDQV